MGGPAPLGGPLGAPEGNSPWSQQGQWTPAPQPGMGAPGMGTSTAEGMSMPTFVASVQPAYEAPGVGLRLVRGLLWGAAFGQIWTILNVFWFFVHGGGKEGSLVSIGAVIIYVFLSSAIGGVAGLVMGAVDASDGAAVGIGVGAGVVYLIIESVLTQNWLNFVNILFYFFTGRLVGRLIGNKVQQPVAK